MNIKTIVDEPERGCGYRKEGGLYLVAGQASAPCGKLPLELTVCPTCGQGIKPARGWTWVDAEKLFADVPCTMSFQKGTQIISECGCPLTAAFLPKHPRMGLLWIGGSFYETPADFLREGAELGISRRISAIPKDFEVGKTWVLFAHRKTIMCGNCNGHGGFFDGEGNLGEKNCPVCDGRGYSPGIFGCFLPQRVEYIVKADDSEEKLQRLEERGITLVRLVRTDNQADMFPAAAEQYDEPHDEILAQQELEEIDRNQILSDIYEH